MNDTTDLWHLLDKFQEDWEMLQQLLDPYIQQALRPYPHIQSENYKLKYMERDWYRGGEDGNTKKILFRFYFRKGFAPHYFDVSVPADILGNLEEFTAHIDAYVKRLAEYDAHNKRVSQEAKLKRLNAKREKLLKEMGVEDD